MVMWNVMLVLWMEIQGCLEELEQYQVTHKALILTFFFYLCIKLSYLLNGWRFWTMNFRSGVRNAIKIAALLLKEQMSGSTLLGRIPPM